MHGVSTQIFNIFLRYSIKLHACIVWGAFFIPIDRVNLWLNYDAWYALLAPQHHSSIWNSYACFKIINYFKQIYLFRAHHLNKLHLFQLIIRNSYTHFTPIIWSSYTCLKVIIWNSSICFKIIIWNTIIVSSSVCETAIRVSSSLFETAIRVSSS